LRISGTKIEAILMSQEKKLLGIESDSVKTISMLDDAASAGTLDLNTKVGHKAASTLIQG
jgi:hypothetical protein